MNESGLVLTVNVHTHTYTQSPLCYVDSAGSLSPWCGDPWRLVGFGCKCAASLMWSILTIDSGAFKVQHLASIPAHKNTERTWKWMGGEIGEKGTTRRIKPQCEFGTNSIVIQSKGVIYKLFPLVHLRGQWTQAEWLSLEVCNTICSDKVTVLSHWARFKIQEGLDLRWPRYSACCEKHPCLIWFVLISNAAQCLQTIR